MKTFDLKLLELDEKQLYKVVEHIVAISHKLGRLFLRHAAAFEDLWSFKVRKQKYEHFLVTSRYLHQEDMTACHSVSVIRNLVKVSVQDMPL